MERAIYRLVVSDSQGQLVTRDFESLDEISSQYRQIGLDNCSMHKELRSLPMFHGLIGPMKEGTVIRYESPDVFEKLTQGWFTPIQVGKRKKR